MRFSFTEEQEELAPRRAALPRGEVARRRGAAADGDGRGLRARRLEAARAGAGAARCRTFRRRTAGRAPASSSSAIVLEEMGRALLLRAVLRRRSRSAANAILNAGREAQKAGAAAGDRRAARRSPRSRSPSRTGAGTRTESRSRRATSRRLDAPRREVVRGRRRDAPTLLVVAARGCAGGSRCFSLRASARRRQPRRALQTIDPDAQARAHPFRRRAREPLGEVGARRRAAREDARPGRGRCSPTSRSAARRSCSR